MGPADSQPDPGCPDPAPEAAHEPVVALAPALVHELIPAPVRPQRRSRRSAAILALGIVVVALNMRPAIASVGPILDQIQRGLDLSVTGASLLTAAPVVCFGLFAAFAPMLVRRLGMEVAVATTLVAILVGQLIRVGPSVLTLFLGTILAGSAIAVANVLLPALMKRDFPRQAGTMTGVYTTALSLSAATAAGATVPITAALGHSWRAGLAFWAIPALVGLAVWAPQLRRGNRHGPVRTSATGTGVRGLLRDRVAWQVTLFMGLQSLGFYALLAWLPLMYQSYGASAARGGLLLSVLAIVGAPTAIIVPTLAARARDQRRYAVGVTLITGAGVIGMLVAPMAAPFLWVVLVGTGLGGSFPLALTLIVLRSHSPLDTARLSAMAQGVGYLIAALGPLAMGIVHDLTGSWKPAMVVMLLVLVPQVLTGLGASKNRYVQTTT